MNARVIAVATLAGLGLGAPVAAAPLTLPMGTEVRLVTATELSSKRQVKGDLIPLTVAADVVFAGAIAIPAGTPATGQVADARAKGAMGMSGRLTIRPLFLDLGGRIVRLAGSESEKAPVEGGAVVGMVVLGAAAFTGKSALIPAGTPILGMVERTVTLDRP